MTVKEKTFGSILPGLLGEYRLWKKHEKAKDTFKEEFFALADEDIEHQGVRMIVVDITALSEESARDRAKRFYPGWNVDEQRPHPWKQNSWEVILMENPSLLPFSIEHNGHKFARTVRKGPVMLDEDWLNEEAPELYEQVTFELPWGARVARPLDKLDPDTLSLVKRYIYNDTPRVSLAAPREVKSE